MGRNRKGKCPLFKNLSASYHRLAIELCYLTKAQIIMPTRTSPFPIIIRDSYIIAIVDTGSTFSLIQQSLWKQLSPWEECQSFLLANGQRQNSLGKVSWSCEIQGQSVYVTFFIMQDSDLTVPVILGIDFLLESRMVLDFHKAEYRMPAIPEPKTFPFQQYDIQPSTHFYLALPGSTCNDKLSNRFTS